MITDTDPGIDDTMAIMMALRSSSLEVLGVTNVFGNHQVEVTTQNALRLLEWLDRDGVPLAQGASL